MLDVGDVRTVLWLDLYFLKRSPVVVIGEMMSEGHFEVIQGQEEQVGEGVKAKLTMS